MIQLDYQPTFQATSTARSVDFSWGRERKRGMRVIDLRCFEIKDGGSCWIILCRRCSAGWLPSKDGHDPKPMIEHAMSHHKLLTRVEELERQICATKHVISDVERDLAADPPARIRGQRKALLRERATYTSWKRALENEFLELVSEGDMDEPRRFHS